MHQQYGAICSLISCRSTQEYIIDVSKLEGEKTLKFLWYMEESFRLCH